LCCGPKKASSFHQNKSVIIIAGKRKRGVKAGNRNRLLLPPGLHDMAKKKNENHGFKISREASRSIVLAMNRLPISSGFK